ncbi:cytochrome C551 [Bacillus sp. M6-12]|uniref:cytochrome c551 n=1 Tax=Bacillus sp. M6-12 TaxID=2054166 RepID=UPI000C765212|nr:cytochrome c [Bacillus sp. M6-12]PLS17913.1 cytochrome C551 [Bacillus sp. M6-12]
MKKKLLALLMGTSLVLAACGGDDSADKEPAEDKGSETTTETSDAGDGNEAKIFENKCASCHGMNLEGGVGPKLADAGSRLSKEDIEKIIAEGKGAMPPGLLEGEEASSVAAWLAAKK